MRLGVEAGSPARENTMEADALELALADLLFSPEATMKRTWSMQ